MITKTNENGASMIEILGVLAVVATIAVGMFTGIARVNQKVKLTQAHAQLTDIVKAMRTQFSAFLPTATDGVVSANSLAKVGVFKSQDVVDDKAVNVYGTSMEISMRNSNVENPFFQVWYSNIQPSVCIDLLMADWGNDPSSGLKSIFVAPNGPSYKTFMWKKDGGGAAGTHLLPPSLEDAIEECSRAKLVTMTWEYYL